MLAMLASGDRRAELATIRVPTLVVHGSDAVSYTHLRAHETVLDLVCRLLLETKQLIPVYPCILIHHSHSR